MRGFIKNEGDRAYFICQRQIPPGGKVEFENLYLSVGKKSGLDEDLEFVKWLRDNVFKRGTWGYYEDVDRPLFAEPAKEKPASKKKKKEPTAKTSSKKGKDARGAGRNLRRDAEDEASTEVTPRAIIEAPYDQARALIEKTKDRAVLKKALALNKHFAGK